jgi:beta-glucosidase
MSLSWTRPDGCVYPSGSPNNMKPLLHALFPGILLVTASIAADVTLGVPAAGEPGTYRDASLPIDRRVADLLPRLSLQEKVGQLNQTIYGWKTYRRAGDAVELTDVLLNEAKHWGGIGGIYGMLRADPWSGVTWETGITPELRVKFMNMAQAAIMKSSRWGIPALFSNEASHGHMTLGGPVLPTAIGIGSTWNPELYQQAARSIATELRLSGEHLALVSCLDVARDPRWGRTEECFSEDGQLVAAFARAATVGMQGENPAVDLLRPDRAGVVLKHLAAQGASSGGRNAAAVVIGEREFREIHLPPVRVGALAGARSFMVAYNEIDGIPCCASPWLLKTVLRGDYGFQGAMMADGTALDILRNEAGTYEGAGISAVLAGIDLSLWDNAFRTLGDSVKAGRLDEKVIDEAVANVLRLKFELGLFEKPFADDNPAALHAAIAETRRLNLQVARESLVLLRNEGGALPLKRGLGRIAVIGPNANSIYAQLGDYTPPQKDGEATTVLAGIRALAGAGTEIVYARGVTHRGEDRSGIAEAVALAKSADAVVVVLGGSSNRYAGTKYSITGAAEVGADKKEMDCGEGVDVSDLDLGGHQVELAQALHATGKPVIAVLIQGRPYSIPWIAENYPAILCAWYPGQEGGRAVAEVLFGDVNPSGRLSVSIPRSSGQLPAYYDYKFRGDRPYYDLPGTALYSFGHGLSYTRFEFTNLRLSVETAAASVLNNGGAITVTVDVANTGARAGAETVQVYLRGVESVITRRVRELKQFAKIELQPGEKRTLTFSLTREELGIWNRNMKFAVAPGLNEIIVQGGDGKSLSAKLRVN